MRQISAVIKNIFLDQINYNQLTGNKKLGPYHGRKAMRPISLLYNVNQ
jgi:hypothetical protein